MIRSRGIDRRKADKQAKTSMGKGGRRESGDGMMMMACYVSSWR